MRSDTAKRGFTLTELLIVIAIIAILAGMLLSAVMSARKRAYVTETRRLVKEIDDAVQMYKQEFGGIPRMGDVSVYYLAGGKPDDTTVDPDGKIWDDDREEAVKAPLSLSADRFNDDLELLDTWGGAIGFSVVQPAGCPVTMEYYIYSNGPDETDGTSDDIGNWGDE